MNRPAAPVDVTAKLADFILWSAPEPIRRMSSVDFHIWIEQRAHLEGDPRRAERIRKLTMADLRAAETRAGWDVADQVRPRLLSPTGLEPAPLPLTSELAWKLRSILSGRKPRRPLSRGW